MLDRTLRLFGPQTAVADPEGTFSWTEFGDRVARAASVLQSLGVERNSGSVAPHAARAKLQITILRTTSKFIPTAITPKVKRG